MVRRVLLGGALVLAGCQSDGAIDIVVPAIAGVKTVRLYTGLGGASSDAIAPEGFNSYLTPNQWWQLDPAASLDVRDASSSDDVVFELARGVNGKKHISIAIVVGFDDAGQIVGTGELHDVEIPTDFIARHFVALDTTRRATTWPAGENTCVAVYDPNSSVAEMVVDPRDPDCDGYTSDTEECDPFFYKSQGTVRLEDTSCVLQSTAIASSQVVATCVLGGPTCIDGGDTTGGCSPSPYCVPQTACQACGYQLDCLYNTASSVYTGPRIQCDLPHDSLGALCPADYAINLQGAWSGLPGCNTDEQLTKEGIYAGDVRYTFAEGEVKVSLHDATQDCAFGLRVEGPLAGDATVAAFVAGSFDNGRGWALPVVVRGTLGGCDDPTAGCHIVGLSSADQFVACVTSPSP